MDNNILTEKEMSVFIQNLKLAVCFQLMLDKHLTECQYSTISENICGKNHEPTKQ